MVALAQAASSYFFQEHPKQLFVGAELCARWYQLYTGSLNSPVTDRMLSYTREAQDVFSWILAGQAFSTLVGRVSNRKFDNETTAAFSELASQAACCLDISANKLFESPIPRFKVLGFASDALGDILGLAETMNTKNLLPKIVKAVKAVASLCLLTRVTC